MRVFVWCTHALLVCCAFATDDSLPKFTYYNSGNSTSNQAIDPEIIVVAVGPTYEDITDSDFEIMYNFAKYYSCDNSTTTCSAEDTAMLENFIGKPNPLAFVHQIVLNDTATFHNVGKADGILAQDRFSGKTLSVGRMMPGSDPRCRKDEYCPKGPCVMLDTNYFGTAVFKHNIKTYNDPNNRNRQWSVVHGETYCGPSAGTTHPFKTTPAGSADAFPQARPVSSQLSVASFSGIVLPLAPPANNPDWYYVDGALGWRTNGPLRREGMPCYGRNVPRWMLPNVCGNGVAGCMNGVNMKPALPDNPQQWHHTMVDPTIGFNGFKETSETDSSFSAKHYDTGNDRFYTKEELNAKAQTLATDSTTKSALAASVLLAPFYGLPASGVHGYSQWPLAAAAAAALNTTARFPFTTDKTNYFTRLTSEAQAIGITTIDLLTTLTDELSEYNQFYKPNPIDTGDAGLPVNHFFHSQRRLMAFTPQGMVSTTSFAESGHRVYHHPLFTHIDNTKNASVDYYLCNTTDCLPKQRNYRYDDSATQIPIPFAASFINIDQAMISYGINKVVTSSTTLAQLKLPQIECQFAGKMVRGSDKKHGECCAVNVEVTSLSDSSYECIKTITGFCGNNDNRCVYTMMNTIANPLASAEEVSELETADKATIKALAYCLILRILPTTSYDGAKRLLQHKDTCVTTGDAIKNHDLFSPTHEMFDALVSRFNTPFAYVKDNGNFTNFCPLVCNPTLPSANRAQCASECGSEWQRKLISPADVNMQFAAKFKCNDKTGYGGFINEVEFDKNTANCDITTADSKKPTTMKMSRSLIKASKLTLTYDPKKEGKCIQVSSTLEMSAACFDLVTDSSHRLLAADGQFMTTVADISTVTSGQGVKRKWDPIAALIGVLTIGMGFGPMLLAAAAAKHNVAQYTRHHATAISEGAVDEGICDLAVCDIARDKHRPEDYDSIPIRCLPRGYSVAQFSTGTEHYAKFNYLGNGNGNGVGQFSSKNCNTSESHDGTTRWFTPNWINCMLSNDPANYPFSIAPTDGASKQYKAVAVDYNNAVPHNSGVVQNTEFKATPRDAGYSQKYHDNNENACICNFEGIVMYQVALNSSTDLDRYSTLTAEIDEYDASEHEIIMTSLSWRAMRNTAQNGLYLGGTSGVTEWVERDLMNRRGNPLRFNETYDRFLKARAPTDDVTASAFVYKRQPGNITVLKSVDDADYNAWSGLQQTEYVTEWTSITSTSCVRFPIGMLHRSQMSADVASAIYGTYYNPPPPVTNFTVNPESQFTPVLQGYCELVNGKYRHCPSDVFSDASDRKRFCESEQLATHYLMGVRINYRARDKRCSPTHKVCIIVPGSPGDNGDEGRIAAHVGPEFANYTLLVTPFNYSTFKNVFSGRRLIPMFGTDVQTMHYLLRDPERISVEEMLKVDLNNSQLMGFGENPDFYSLMTNLEAYITANLTPDGSTSRIAMVGQLREKVDTLGLALVFELGKVHADDIVPNYLHTMRGFNKRRTAATKCAKNSFWIPEYDMELATSRQCVGKDVLYPQHPESGIVVQGEGIWIRSASAVEPLQLGSEIPGVSTCTRFLIAAANVHVEASIDQSNCAKKSDTFHRTPVRLLGKNVSGTTVNITYYIDAGDSDAVIVSLLGADQELFAMPTNLSADNVQIHIPSLHNGMFDVALGRTYGHVSVVKPQQNVRLLVQQSSGKTISMSGNGYPCSNGDFAPDTNAPCEYINVTEYTALFGYKFEHRAFRIGIRADILAWILLAVLLVVAVVMGLYILLSKVPGQIVQG